MLWVWIRMCGGLKNLILSSAKVELPWLEETFVLAVFLLHTVLTARIWRSLPLSSASCLCMAASLSMAVCESGLYYDISKARNVRWDITDGE